jgi:hypothetical protein
MGLDGPSKPVRVEPIELPDVQPTKAPEPEPEREPERAPVEPEKTPA